MAFTVGDYDPIALGIARSAATVAPDLVRLLDPASVVDVGCGQGGWLLEFARHGCDITGWDGHDGTGLLIAPADYHWIDLATARNGIGGPYDLALCLEVAEHVPTTRADWLINTLCDAAPVIVFSAAIPGQGGQNHINERWPSYWISRFDRRDYEVSGALRWLWWDCVPHALEPWYAQNMLLCVHRDELQARPAIHELFNGPWTQPHGVVHPVSWTRRLGLPE